MLVGVFAGRTASVRALTAGLSPSAGVQGSHLGHTLPWSSSFLRSFSCSSSKCQESPHKVRRSPVPTSQSSFFSPSLSRSPIFFESTRPSHILQVIRSRSTDAKAAEESKQEASSKGGSGLLVRLRDQLLAQASKSASKGAAEGATPTPTFPDVRRLIELASTQRKMIFLALVFLVISASIALTVPLAIGKVIDFFTQSFEAKKEGKEGGPKLYGLSLSTVAVLLVAIFATGAFCKAGSNIMLELAGIRVIQRMREVSYSSALRQEVEWADRGAGDVVSRLSVDTNIVGEAITSDIGDGLRAGVTVLFAGSAMFLISSQLTLLMMAVVPPAAIGAVFYGRYLRDLTHRTQDAVGAMTRTAEERLSPPAFRTITAHNTQKTEDNRFKGKVQTIVDLQTKEAYATGFFYAGTGFVGNCAILTLLTYGGSLVAKGVITVGDLTSLLMVCMRSFSFFGVSMSVLHPPFNSTPPTLEVDWQT